MLKLKTNFMSKFLLASLFGLILICRAFEREDVIHEVKEDCDRIAQEYRCYNQVWLEIEQKCLFYECLDSYNTCKSSCSHGITIASHGLKEADFYDCAPRELCEEYKSYSNSRKTWITLGSIFGAILIILIIVKCNCFGYDDDYYQKPTRFVDLDPDRKNYDHD